jgi:hypothetical protein
LYGDLRQVHQVPNFCVILIYCRYSFDPPAEDWNGRIQ